MRAFEEIPGPPAANSIGSAYKLMRMVQSDLLGMVCAAFQEYGDIVVLEVLGRKQVLVIAPAQIREVLVEHADCYVKGADYTDTQKGIAKFTGAGLLTSNGELWKRQRRLVAPALHKKRIASYTQAMVEASEATLDGWKDGQTIELDHAMMATTLEIVARTLFHTDVSRDAERIAEAMKVLQGMIEANNSAWTILPAWFPTAQRMRENRAVRTLDEVVYRLMRERRPTEDGPVVDTGDLCSMLLGAEDEEGKRMSDRQARDEIVTMFLAGHETTANTLLWTWILLAQHPETEAKLHEELDRVLGGRAPTVDDLRSLELTEAIIEESLRLYPPAYTFMRSCVKDTTLGDYAIPAGTDVSMIPYATHRDPRFFADPAAFVPERHLGERAKEIDRYAWIPFGGGARVCVGNAFAMTEAIVMLAMVASRFTLRLVEGQEVRADPGLTLRPKAPLRATLHAR